jgi:hypothetical protein
MEALRQVRQIETLTPFMIGTDHALSQLLRATVAPRLFPASLDDADLMSEPLWPSAEEVISLLNPKPASDAATEPDAGTPSGRSEHDHDGSSSATKADTSDAPAV